MSPSPSTLFCLGVCLVQVMQAPSDPLPKPSLRALPSSLVPLGKSVTLRCLGPPGVDLYRLEKLGSGQYEDKELLFIPTMKAADAGRYRCSYQNGSTWSPPSDKLELVATGVFSKPSLSAHPSPEVPPGGHVTLQCQTKYGFDQFALYKEGDTGPYRRPEKLYQADFPIITVTAAHSGTYQCYSFSSSSPYLWSAPSNPLVLVVTGASATPSQVPKAVRSSRTELPEASSTLTMSSTNAVSATEMSRKITFSPEGSNPPFGLAHQHYVKENLIRICLGAMILIFLAGLLAEDWYSRKKPLPRRIRAVQRPLPPLPGTQKSHSFPDGARPDVQNHGCHC